MLTEADIRGKLLSAEDHFVERKREGANAAEIRKTLVAFANSLPEGQHALLFLGVGDRGEIAGVADTDSLQRTVRNTAENDCYPPVKCTCVVLREDGLPVVAVVVESSKERPHFTGPAYVRRGSESVKASPALYEDLIASRNDKARRIIAEKGKGISVKWKNAGIPGVWWSSTIVPPSGRDYRINACDAHCVQIEDLNYGHIHNVPLEKVAIASVSGSPRMKLVITDWAYRERGRERDQRSTLDGPA